MDGRWLALSHGHSRTDSRVGGRAGFITNTPLPGEPVEDNLLDELDAGDDAIPM